MTTTQIELITDNQKDRIADLAREATKNAIKNVNPEKDQAQKIVEQPGEFKQKVEDAVYEILRQLTTPNQYADQETRSEYTYPDEYTGPKPIMEQVNTVAEIFGLDSKDALEFIKTLPALPKGAEAWFAIPKVSAVAMKHFSHVTDRAQQFCDAIKLACSKMDDSRDFYNGLSDQLTPNHIRMHARTAEFIQQIEEQQSGDIIIIAGQLGMAHRGQSVNRARATFKGNEFGLDPFVVLCIALTHPDRLEDGSELDMDCAGGEFSPDGDGVFSECPCLCFSDGRVGFGADGVSDVCDYFGSASAFVPQV